MDGQVAMVTGAANGIGRAIVERFVAEGMQVVAVDISERDLTEATASYGERVHAAVADISDRSQVQAAVHAALFRFGQLDVLAANAGIADGEPFLEIEDKSWRRIIDVNIHGTFHCVQEAAKVMATARKGAIVCTSSTNAW